MRTITKREIIYNYVTADNDKTKEFYGELAKKINLGVSIVNSITIKEKLINQVL